ncbi:ChuX/HutX family heme-like substrate-binding protein [Nannocystis sp. SCPEA4]|uniref:hemin-degrading factor n=1 Tax=Nannocystis sp. SCPEA4 TaxID=2996787 RepID=UPI002271B329|nr:ChuX/HutX family heme-like substrate-binding protein [Nannocystis sp. SCPEA4]MCY1060941.1 hemin-degrading factor [Nannocystis sp. SCPEA4]
MQPATSPQTPSLAQSWRDLRASEPKLRIRDAATRLGVSEAELRATECGTTTVRLVDDWPAILRRLPLLGEVMALTRNESAVHEKIGEYPEPEISGPHCLVHGTGPIDLRIFLSKWAHGFAVEEDGKQSLHFFDAHGDAVHKIYAKEKTELAEYRMLVDIFRSEDQRTSIALTARPARKADTPDAELDVPALQAGWRGLRDTHDFFGLLRKHGVSRLQAMRLAPEGFVRPVAKDSIDKVLNAAAASELPIMIFVGNPGCLQIHTGPVRKIVPMGPWINVLDPGFNLHLRRDHVASAFVVDKPTDDGTVTSLELFDAHGDNIALLFGERKPGRPELPAWRELLNTLDGAEDMS